MVWAILVASLRLGQAGAQVPEVPGTAQPETAADPAGSPPAVLIAPTEDNPEATAAESAGPIPVHSGVSDASVRSKLERLLPRYPGVRRIEVEVEDGVVTLTGHVADAEVRDRLRDFVRRVEGVNLVLNRTRTDAQVLTAQDFALKKLGEWWDLVSRRWLLTVLALGIVAATVLLARLFGQYGEVLLTPVTSNPLLRSVLKSVLAAGMVGAGILTALNVIGMTEAVLSFLGLAGVVALAVGFAFRDIVENFIASIMLGVRRPFRVGDVVEVAGFAGVVKSLNTRATVLVTIEGAQVRIPNAIVFKSTIVNRTASSSVRSAFDVIVPWEASVAAVSEAIAERLRTHEAIDESPPPRVLVEAIEPEGVRLRASFWRPSQGIDDAKLLSDAKLAARVALQALGTRPAAGELTIRIVDAPAVRRRSETATRHSEESEDQARAADARAALAAASQRPSVQQDDVGHALDVAGKAVSEEGRNLIEDDAADKEP
jgi:small-conductance mechanosensitive channel